MSTSVRVRGKAGGLFLVLVLVALAAMPVVGVSSNAAGAAAKASAKFESGSCPKTSTPVPALATARCGTLVVPENWSKPDGRTIRLAVAVIPATSPTPGAVPVVYIHGGPGGDVFGALPDLVSAGVNTSHELILLAQRGSYSSQPNLLCPQLDAAFAAAVPLGYTNPKTRKAVVRAATACHSKFVREGIDLNDFNTTQMADDLAGLRTALGIKEWDVFGHSFGTTLALAYVRDHPKGINALILDGSQPPSAVSIAFTWKAAQEAFNNVFDACAAQPSCAAKYPHLDKTFTRLGQELQAHPVKTKVTLDDGKTVSVTLDAEALLSWMTFATHIPTTIPAYLQALADGDPKPIAKQWATSKQDHSGEVGAFSWGEFDSVWCSEAVPFSTPAQDLKAGERALPGFPRSVLSDSPTLALFYLRDQCKVWDVAKAPSSFRAPTKSSVPTLLLNGSFDAQTAPSNGAYVVKSLSHATNLVFPGAAHAVYADSPCGQSVIRSFLDNPYAPDTSCVPAVKPAPFATSLKSGPVQSPEDEPQDEPS